MNIVKKGLVIFGSIICVLVAIFGLTFQAFAQNQENNNEKSKGTEKIQVGETIRFGGSPCAPEENKDWYVVAKDGDKLELFQKDCTKEKYGRR